MECLVWPKLPVYFFLFFAGFGFVEVRQSDVDFTSKLIAKTNIRVNYSKSIINFSIHRTNEIVIISLILLFWLRITLVNENN